MFYELYDWDFYADDKELHLVNLDEVLQINRVVRPDQYRNDKTGKVYPVYKIKIYYTGKSNEWAFYYRSESEQFLAYDNLKRVLAENNRLIKEKPIPNPLVDDIVNTIENDFHPLEDLLNNPPLGDVPDVRY